MTAEWVRPTARATSWGPLAAVAAGLLAVGALVAVSEASPAGLVGLAAAALAAAVVAGLHDPAADLLAAVPSSAARRRTYRLAMLAPAGLLAWVALVSVGRLVTPDWDAGWALGPVVAFAATGVAVAVWAPAGLQVAAGVAAPMLWFALSRVTTGLDGPLADAASAWQHHSWTVSGVALAVALLGRNR